MELLDQLDDRRSVLGVDRRRGTRVVATARPGTGGGCHDRQTHRRRKESRMEHRPVPRLDHELSVIGLGCWQLGADWGEVSEDSARAQVTFSRLWRYFL